MITADALRQIDQLLGPRGYLDRPEDLTLYEYDGSVDKAQPELVVFPQTAEQVVALVQIAREHRIPIVGRGAGTGLSGGVIARAGGIVISFARMNRIVEIDLANERAVLEPGVVNLEITQAVERDGYFYAPDPSSQKACTIGGNVSENAGGPHTLAYGVTTNHVLGIETVLPDGTPMTVGGKSLDTPGYDLTGLLTGSEGTMALVTKITVRLMRAAGAGEDAARHLRHRRRLRGLGGRDHRARHHSSRGRNAGRRHAAHGGRSHARGLSDGRGRGVADRAGRLEGSRRRAGAADRGRLQVAAARARFASPDPPLERELLWKGRKNAFGAVGRVSPAYYVQDGVVPRTKIAPTLREIHKISEKYGLTISNIFHAGDGNMHPIILFNHHKAGELERAKAAGDEILRFCIEQGGSITGEHGVGMEKMELIGEQFSGETLDHDRAIQEAVRSGVPPESRQNAAHRQGLHGNPPAGRDARFSVFDRERCGVAGSIAGRNHHRRRQRWMSARAESCS